MWKKANIWVMCMIFAHESLLIVSCALIRRGLTSIVLWTPLPVFFLQAFCLNSSKSLVMSRVHCDQSRKGMRMSNHKTKVANVFRYIESLSELHVDLIKNSKIERRQLHVLLCRGIHSLLLLFYKICSREIISYFILETWNLGVDLPRLSYSPCIVEFSCLIVIIGYMLYRIIR